ncbi:MAG: hypothetical protein DRQ60_04315 [Gammaproteobacteria bacterium]|nr:MAG: hypothetical protein DRQ54_08185 [Gammaproteobacteria bacterium]RLA16503.1 MAG: hypothetical protein DRQ60_04315 [Gammaproteobacteria bacterium]
MPLNFPQAIGGKLLFFVKNLSVLLWGSILIGIGLAIFSYKAFVLGLPTSPGQQTKTWTVQAQITFKGQRGPAIVDLKVPKITPGFSILDEDFISSKFGLTLQAERESRTAQWAIRRARGDLVLYYRLFVAPSTRFVDWQQKPSFPYPPDFEEPYASAIRAIMDDVRNESADVSTYTRELLQQLNAEHPNENIALIRNNARDDTAWTMQIIDILKGVRIPARILWGIPLGEASNDVALQQLLQVHNGEAWLTFNPRSGAEGIPDNFLAWKTGNEPLIELTGGEDAEITFSITSSYRDLIEVTRLGAKQLDSALLAMSPIALPVPNQNVYRLLLMLPIGALVVVCFRTFIGVSTFGTFMPILIALAFRETQLLWGLLSFSVIVMIGLFIRFYLERLMLLLVPRLTSILIIVLILMLVISLVSNLLGLERVLSVALFPMVILAMTIERMSITWEEHGAREALYQGLGSLLVASVGYLLMSNEDLTYLMFVFPEMLLVLLGLSLWMGRYTGYRLTELWRFRALASDQ